MATLRRPPAADSVINPEHGRLVTPRGRNHSRHHAHDPHPSLIGPFMDQAAAMPWPADIVACLFSRAPRGLAIVELSVPWRNHFGIRSTS